jgi:hypothetical protein
LKIFHHQSKQSQEFNKPKDNQPIKLEACRELSSSTWHFSVCVCHCMLLGVARRKESQSQMQLRRFPTNSARNTFKRTSTFQSTTRSKRFVKLSLEAEISHFKGKCSDTANCSTCK